MELWTLFSVHPLQTAHRSTFGLYAQGSFNHKWVDAVVDQTGIEAPEDES